MVTTVSTKYQMVIPKEARQKLNIKPGEKLFVNVEKNMLIIRPTKIKKWEDLGGIARGMFDKDGGVDEYLRKERASWDF